MFLFFQKRYPLDQLFKCSWPEFWWKVLKSKNEDLLLQCKWHAVLIVVTQPGLGFQNHHSQKRICGMYDILIVEYCWKYSTLTCSRSRNIDPTIFLMRIATLDPMHIGRVHLGNTWYSNISPIWIFLTYGWLSICYPPLGISPRWGWNSWLSIPCTTVLAHISHLGEKEHNLHKCRTVSSQEGIISQLKKYLSHCIIHPAET